MTAHDPVQVISGTDGAIDASREPPLASRLMRNSGWILASQLWFPVLSLVATPYIVHAMGVQRYGVFALLSVFGGYLSYLGLGFGWAIIKFVAEHDAKRDNDTLRRIVATSLFTALAGGLIGCLLLVVFARPIATQLLRLPPELTEEATFGLVLTGLAFALNSSLEILNGVLKGIHRFDVTSTIQVIFGTATIAGIVTVLYAGYGLRGAVLVGVVVSAASVATHAFILSRLRPTLSLIPRFHVAEFKRMFGFSAFTTVNRVGMTAILQLDKLFVVLFLPVEALTHYSIAFTVAQKLNMIASNVSSVLFPMASEQFAADGFQHYKNLYNRVAELVFLLTIVPAAVLAIFAKDFLRVWMGAAFAENSATPLIFLAAGFAAVSVASVEAISIDGAGQPRVTAGFLLISGVANLVLCPFLTRIYGISGTAAAVALSLLLLAVLNIRFFNQTLLRASFVATFRRNYLRPILVAAVACTCAYGALQLPLGDLTSVLSAMAVIAMLACGIGVWIALTQSERQAVKALVYSSIDPS